MNPEIPFGVYAGTDTSTAPSAFGNARAAAWGPIIVPLTH
jgi:hypothetical protein